MIYGPYKTVTSGAFTHRMDAVHPLLSFSSILPLWHQYATSQAPLPMMTAVVGEVFRHLLGLKAGPSTGCFWEAPIESCSPRGPTFWRSVVCCSSFGLARKIMGDTSQPHPSQLPVRYKNHQTTMSKYLQFQGPNALKIARVGIFLDPDLKLPCFPHTPPGPAHLWQPSRPSWRQWSCSWQVATPRASKGRWGSRCQKSCKGPTNLWGRRLQTGKKNCKLLMF